VRATRILPCPRKKQARMIGIYHYIIIPRHISSKRLELLPQISSDGKWRGRLSQLNRLINDGPEWLSDTLVSLFASALDSLLG
jgi:hypothetical protein